jgi:hypothetical protein
MARDKLAEAWKKYGETDQGEAQPEMGDPVLGQDSYYSKHYPAMGEALQRLRRKAGGAGQP